jgi:hypothetical protein
MQRPMALKHSNGEAMMAMKLVSPLEGLGGHDPIIAGEKYIPLLGGLFPINLMHHCGMSSLLCDASGLFLLVTTMVMEVVVGHWPLAIGRLVLTPVQTP